ncbi:four helix bundle protein [Bacteroidota bacterium]
MREQLESRLIILSQDIDKLCNNLKNSFISNHLSKQIIRSSTSAALNYGEVQASESRKDFIHKVSLVLKELRETHICLQLLSNSIKENERSEYKSCDDECNQLIAIYHKTLITAKSKL